MNGIEKITSRITAEAETAAAAVLAEAEAKAAEIRGEYTKKAEEVYESRMTAGKQEIAEDAERILRAARLDARKDTLAVKQEMITMAYDTAKNRLLGMGESEYITMLAGLAANAAASGSEEIILNAADRARLGDKLLAEANAAAAAKGKKAGLTLSGETREISGGLILREGCVEVNCSVESLLDMSHSRLDAEVAAILFH